MKIGGFIPISNGLSKAAEQMHEYGGNCMMIYTGSPRGFARSAINQADVAEGHAKMKELGITDLIVHAPYVMNPANPDPSMHSKAIGILGAELERTRQYGSNLLVVHPGSHVGAGATEGIKQLVDVLNTVLNVNSPTICIETMAGKGKEIGRDFYEMAKILDGVKLQDKVAVCLDTCHIHDAGYDIRFAFSDVLKQFDKLIGLERIKVIHVNDSINVLSSHKDRHANIGKGCIHAEALQKLCQLEIFKDVPKILETPELPTGGYDYAREIELLKQEITE